MPVYPELNNFKLVIGYNNRINAGGCSEIRKILGKMSTLQSLKLLIEYDNNI